MAISSCSAAAGDTIEQTVRWKSGSDVSRLKGRAIRMRVVMHDADLYSFRFLK